MGDRLWQGQEVADAVEGDLSYGREVGFCCGLSAWRVADGGALRGLRHQPQDGLQMARSLSRAGPGGLGGALSCAAPSRSVDGAGAGRGDCRSAQAASPLGSAQAARSADGRAPRGGVACGQHDGRSAACGRAGERPPPAPSSCCRARAAVPCRHRAQRCVVHRLQGLVPHPRRRTLRPADRQRYSRFLLACVIVPPRTDTVRVAVEQLFKRYGLPLAIRSDNGARSPERARADCLVCRSAGSRPASRWSASSRASRSRTDGTSACIGP